jgi:hypothetical protein
MINPRKQRILNIYGKDPSTLDELAHCVITVANSNLAKEEIHAVGFAWTIVYSDNIKNSHNAPLGKETNWCRHADAPRGYPGFSVRVWIRYSRAPKRWGSDMLNSTLTYPGTGGGGSYGGIWQNISHQRYKKRESQSGIYVEQCHCYGWDYKIFLEDWPLLEQYIGVKHTWDILQTGKQSPIVHQFEWNDPDTVEDDQLFLQQVREEVCLD